MDGADFAKLVEAGEQFFFFKLFLTSMHCLLVYDCFLTLGDEIKYAWAGRRSWMFVLFLANRYTPVLGLVWGNAIMHSYTSSFCQHTKWLIIFMATAILVLAQMAVATRIYAMTERNKLFGAVLLALIAAQFCFGIYSVVWVAMRPAQPVPEIDLDVFKICSYQQWRFGELLFINIALAFDLLAFAIIFFTAKRRGAGRYPGIPSILDTIFRDATIYFVTMFFGQLLAEVLTFVTLGVYQLLPWVASSAIIPIMVSRFMLSLKKACSRHAEPRSLPTINFGPAGFAGDENTHSASPTHDESHGISGPSPTPNQEDVELDSMSQSQLQWYTPNVL